jgi:hypothetical protein
LPPDGAQRKDILAINIQHSNKKGKYIKEKPLIYAPNKHPAHIHAKSFKTR